MLELTGDGHLLLEVEDVLERVESFDVVGEGVLVVLDLVDHPVTRLLSVDFEAALLRVG